MKKDNVDTHILSRVEDLLSSVDIEMVKLGAIILSQSFPQKMWAGILEKHCKTESRVVNVRLPGIPGMSGMGVVSSYTLPSYYKWQWSIKRINRRKKTARVEITGPDELYSATFTTNTTISPSYKIYTGQAGMQLIQQSIKQALAINQLKTNKHEQSKINNKRNKGCARTTFK